MRLPAQNHWQLAVRVVVRAQLGVNGYARTAVFFLLAVEPERLEKHGAQITISFLDHQPLLYVIAATSGKLAGPPGRLRGLECHVSWLVSARVCAYVQVCVEVLNKQRGFGSGWALVKIM